MWVLLIEHLALFILFPIFPIIGFITGLLLGLLGKIPPLKAWHSLLITLIIISISFGYSELRGFVLRERREHIVSALAMINPDSKITDQHYSGGNGMEEPPNITVLMESDNSFDEIKNQYENYFQKNDWQPSKGAWFTGTAWKKNNYEVFLHDKTKNATKVVYQLNVDFLGSWVTHFAKI